ncbi:sushi, nidogen and EGF-like domain-containing protein 1 isoform X2 [Danio aesculapii]|uniref:sushi, nidogen and EGF-like domain-containing protein 1 isoform X2 n=1 Tax=Danio aesculapii TaxID=1142201 RepID=UPI0024C094F4|nr:sushi, nidogen and EGF-like domain-containing protein 1 isoform X2 [Danio aesculapii]
MKLILVLQRLLLFISVLGPTRAQSTTQTTLAENTPLESTTAPSVIAMSSAQPWTVPEIFYSFGSAEGDTEHIVNFDESSYPVALSSPFTFFGHTYNSLYVIYNGLLTFTITSTSGPNYSPFRGREDFIAALWNDYDDYYTGVLSYQQYTNGSVLDRATQDINQHFSAVNFRASWVFVATWRYNLQPNPAILFQVVLISGGNWSFFLMNYGDCAFLYEAVEAGYDTINSVSKFVIPDSTNGNYRNLKNTTNVNVPGRWAFISNKGLENIIGTQFKLTSFLDLTQSDNLEAVLQQIKQVLVSRGLSGNFEIQKRSVKEVQP